MNYLVMILLTVGFGFIDATIKAFTNWNELPTFFQGWSWHIFLFVVYLVFLGFTTWIRKLRLRQIVGGVLLWVNEDLVYYIIKSIVLGNLYWNSWLFNSIYEYLSIIVALNFLAYLLIRDK